MINGGRPNHRDRRLGFRQVRTMRWQWHRPADGHASDFARQRLLRLHWEGGELPAKPIVRFGWRNCHVRDGANRL
jgi:hypothetical protein